MNFKALFKNLPLISVFLSAIFASFRSMGYGAAIYFFQHTLNRIELSTILGFFSGPISYAVMALMPILGKKFSSRNIMIGGYLYTAFMYFMMFIIGYDNIILLCIIIAISGAPVGIIRIAGSITVAESIQYMEWKTGIRSESMVFSINTLKNKITATLSSVWLPIGLSIIGYQTAKTVGEQVVQSEATKQGLFLIYALAPLFGSLFAGLILFIDPFYGKKKEKIMAELKERQNEKMNFTEIESAN